MNKRALIVGITGQDGAYLGRHLIGLGYTVLGSTRDVHACDSSRLVRVGIKEQVELISLVPGDFRSVLSAVNYAKPNVIFNLSGQSSVGLSFDQPVECVESIVTATLNFLEVIRFLDNKIKFFNASSSECFGDTGNNSSDEHTSFSPQSPYAVAKAAAFWLVSTHRDAYGLYACSGILSNHESPLRSPRFVTQKIIQAVKDIRDGRKQFIQLGNLDVYRDWGWAPDYVKAIHLLVTSKEPKDYIIASGVTSSLREFVKESFLIAGLDAEKYVQISTSFMRPSDLLYSSLNPARIRQDLGWSSSLSLREIVHNMYHETLY